MYRVHQQAVIDYGQRIAEGTASNNSAIAWVVPGGGKSWLPPLLLNALEDEDWKLAWFVPRLNLATQAEMDTLLQHGIRIRKSGNDIRPARDTRGFVTTHQCLSTEPQLWASALNDGSRWVLFFDELHHAYIDSDGTLSTTARALDGLPYDVRVLMTGTLERSDPTQRIYGVDYEPTREGFRISSHIDIRYDRQTALLPSEGPAIVPVVFEHHDGPVKWDNLKTNKEEGGQLSKLKRDEEGVGVWTACRTGIAEQMLRRGLTSWRENSDGKALVVCANQEDARRWLKVAGEYSHAALAISDEGEAAQESIKRFRVQDSCRILVTVAMAYEGLDVPSITHGICLTHIRSTPWIEQMLARAWRKTASKTECYWWVPDDPRMNRVIKRIRAEQPADVVLPRDGGNGGNGDKVRIPLSSESAHRRISGLDATDECSDTDMVESFLRCYGLADLIPQAKAKMQREEVELSPQSELEKTYRKQLWVEIVRIHNEYRTPHARIGWKLNQRMGTNAERATLLQLRDGIRYARENWPTIAAR